MRSYFFSRSKLSLSKILVPHLVKYKMFNILTYLFILNLNTIAEILPKKKMKYKAIVLSKAGGIEDLIASQKLYNKDILYLNCQRKFFKYIFHSIFGDKILNLSDLKYVSKNPEIEQLKKNYKEFLKIFLKTLQTKYKFNIFIGFNFKYLAEREVHTACSELKIPFLILYKESIHTEIQKKYFLHVHKKTNEKFHGFKVAVYSKYAKKFLTEPKIAKSSKIEIVGCSRLYDSFLLRKIKPNKQILYYAIQDDRGLPTPLIIKYGKYFFKNLDNKKIFDINSDWRKLHLKIIKILKKFALNYPDITIQIKIKNKNKSNKNDYVNLPKNINVIYSGAGHELLRDSKIVIGWNTTYILEAIAANRFILLPYFFKKNNLNQNKELNLNLKKKNYGFNETDFYKKLNYFLNKDYKINITNNDHSALKYYLGNADNKAVIKLNKFIKNNLNY